MDYSVLHKTAKATSEGRYLLPLAVLFIVAILCFAIFFFELQLSKNIDNSIEEKLRESSTAINSQVQENITKYKNDLHFLYSTPPIAGLARAAANSGNDPLDKTTAEQWKKRLETIFVAFLKSNLEYEQLRIISTQQTGQELIRVDRAAGGIVVKAQNQLQNKRSRDYYQQSADLSQGEMYLSTITLNREYGKLEFPYKPMLRIALPIFNDDMERYGLIIANINIKLLFNSLNAMVQRPNSLILTDSKGYFLIHPNSDLEFSRDLMPTKRWNTVYKSEPTTHTKLMSISANTIGEKPSEALSKRIPLTGDLENGFIDAHLVISDDNISKMELEQRTGAYLFLLGISITLIIILSFVNRNLKRNRELAEARAVSSAIISGSKDAIIGVNNIGLVSSWNRAASELFALQREQVIGTNINKLTLLPNIDIQKQCNELKINRKQHTIELEYQPENKPPVNLALAFSAIIDDHYQHNGTAIIIRDITVEKVANDKIKQANNELEIKVAKRTADLEKASKIKSAFISNISHEMRTPLNGIIGTLNLIKRESLTNQQQHYLEMTEVSVNSLNVLINDILDLSKIEAGKLDLDHRAFNPIKLFESLSGSLAIKAQEKNLEFILDITGIEYCSIVTDPHRYSQVLTNLINNAIKFTKAGFIKVVATTTRIDDEIISLSCSIQDTGIGIPLENQNKLFNAFTQADNSVAAQYGGTGLGLSICKQLAVLLNGQISFESSEGKGSTFNFIINLNSHEAQKRQPHQRLQNRTIALSVKQPELKSSIEKLITQHGGQLSEVTIENFELNEEKPFDTLILEPAHPLFTKLDSLCEHLPDYCLPFKLVLLVNPTEPAPQTKYSSFIRISKPVLTSEFLLKLVDERLLPPSFQPEDKPMRRETDSQVNIDLDIAGAKALIVDDNEINAAVAKGTLANLGIQFEIASNGQQAINILAQTAEDEPFHCVLMDCQMPILNGYEAAAQIRKGSAGEHHIDIPIIAMTANAMLGERKKCLHAGMNDYITKPISADKLITTTVKWIASNYPKNNLKTETKAPYDSVELSHIEQTSQTKNEEKLHWDKEAALSRLMNNEVLLNKVSKMFLDSSQIKITTLTRAIKDKDYHAIATTSHTLKGACGDVGAAKLHKHFTELEVLAASKEDHLKDIQLKLLDIERDYKTLLDILQKHTVAKVS
ncbi:ATP-binding protein [Pseudoalteromonas sp. N1230-9]|uniref:ATP-binding protein n=1 Tax=Pseudoalteromonas sp. N1230-9 TaxID=2907156 RepID=UPI002B2BDEEB|nr:ATP-binding protein [Pseudoalteromonas sp. N1230-9]